MSSKLYYTSLTCHGIVQPQSLWTVNGKTLSSDLWKKIAAYLPPLELNRFRRVCKACFILYCDDRIWQLSYARFCSRDKKHSPPFKNYKDAALVHAYWSQRVGLKHLFSLPMKAAFAGSVEVIGFADNKTSIVKSDDGTVKCVDLQSLRSEDCFAYPINPDSLHFVDNMLLAELENRLDVAIWTKHSCRYCFSPKSTPNNRKRHFQEETILKEETQVDEIQKDEIQVDEIQKEETPPVIDFCFLSQKRFLIVFYCDGSIIIFDTLTNKSVSPAVRHIERDFFVFQNKLFFILKGKPLYTVDLITGNCVEASKKPVDQWVILEKKAFILYQDLSELELTLYWLDTQEATTSLIPVPAIQGCFYECTFLGLTSLTAHSYFLLTPQTNSPLHVPTYILALQNQQITILHTIDEILLSEFCFLLYQRGLSIYYYDVKMATELCLFESKRYLSVERTKQWEYDKWGFDVKFAPDDPAVGFVFDEKRGVFEPFKPLSPINYRAEHATLTTKLEVLWRMYYDQTEIILRSNMICEIHDKANDQKRVKDLSIYEIKAKSEFVQVGNKLFIKESGRLFFCDFSNDAPLILLSESCNHFYIFHQFLVVCTDNEAIYWEISKDPTLLLEQPTPG